MRRKEKRGKKPGSTQQNGLLQASHSNPRKGLEVAVADRCTVVPCGAAWEEGLSGGKKIQLGWEWGARP